MPAWGKRNRSRDYIRADNAGTELSPIRNPASCSGKRPSCDSRTGRKFHAHGVTESRHGLHVRFTPPRQGPQLEARRFQACACGAEDTQQTGEVERIDRLTGAVQTGDEPAHQLFDHECMAEDGVARCGRAAWVRRQRGLTGRPMAVGRSAGRRSSLRAWEIAEGDGGRGLRHRLVRAAVRAFVGVPTAMPSADFCAAMTVLANTLSPGLPDTSQTSRGKTDRRHRTPAELTTRPLMAMDFAIIGPLVRPGRPRIRFLSIGSRLCSTLPSDPASRRHPSASPILRRHQAG